ncbi:MAG: hypothetical protein C4557_01360 [Anaerolineaceae bacterium]|nr:MAG: hypothetical protein C4557_01360 [Anaerolineaceae bacterium]
MRIACNGCRNMIQLRQMSK